ncbi:UDP-N-acetylmuramate:L-alanyl-gamma-D-glutamyl-meso-diaminopimelate ligase [bacterium endosymbiont of Bathymodiolus sp. 5 South]|jgi:UDP-N-acetylmuramate: L-alanyl-gamma-D-glutamyl-meso-diaminopimelate ligase|uniref:UDP-N-acetylmuramate:L-alanyl-gamma-D-glutamyl- meso-diaminopimelate ligase n=1 Tax=bacterium endosymbiont of Bathymodiolus sp. 5 South TaxID=1181670 RepID=UPI0010B62B18|nr:UDP-N-acetylmuramate:L-alanyl-gamma-D-glutamyl-meso-diaminopimelate ligase [bacterium endosymbiont of Bathymodiolus sp. 5 South]VVH59775.1 UDP-N-acetylmuramate:L-alanyl-gamma-D-glutamyl-meso-diaminopimelate ligase (EC [uncultured Gammaproteobacteria bacterium]SHN89654.1 UDP-N-acetylmuramate:L-alanyl-gamma-D-glutamyl-meso-diaminopimelate ligase [bacterium endosymbiont of Bathymodiolus sp. 5 South]SSC08634.1 UDP-N-acetylmuramate:L-alanyl-gamma-D-glutamyl-meso-diaminopimelate ligase [bacterium e
MHIHILGIAGTFMGSLALIAKQLGHSVTGQDQGVYPPMSTQLDKQSISYTQGYHAKDLPKADVYIIGNALPRGNECVEEILNKQYAYTSGAQWLSENVLHDKWVLAISGTHGKTTTASMLAWILEVAGYNPSFLIGGVVEGFGVSSRLTDSNFFVIEADEYDTAFFDKRSKFVHYHPKTLVINNLEFDHADIFDSLKDIQKQFHYLLRTLPNDGLIIHPQNVAAIEQVIEMGLYSQQQTLPTSKLEISDIGTTFDVEDNTVNWNLLGEHNMQNGLCAIYAAHHIGVEIKTACEALNTFQGVKRRLEIKYQTNNITLYDDFAHHPTAIQTTLCGLRAKVGNKNIVAILELRSNTMKSGVHQQSLVDALSEANQILILKPENQDWDIDTLFSKDSLFVCVEDIVAELSRIQQGHFVVMSNADFDDIFNKIIAKL